MSQTPIPDRTSKGPTGVRIFTLGQFRIEIDGGSIRLGARGQGKPVELLKVLIALGGHDVPELRLSDTLWPDSEGDHAHRTFITNLHRLRNLIGHQTVQSEDGRVTLLREHCWVDSHAFSMELEGAEGATKENADAAAWGRMEKALALYRGQFLEGEYDPPEILSARERLHSKLLRHIGLLGEYFARQEQLEKTILLYQKGLEIDDLAEEIYQRLMRCHHQQGRLAEGIAVYQRCRRMLRAKLELAPSPETDRIYQSLVTDKGVPPAGGPREISLPDKPSVAVLAFDNLSTDAEQEFFSDGISENIITSLSKIPDLFVIARNSSFTYKGKPVNVHTVGIELGVRYVLEGSVRRAGGRVRITAQLIDATTNRQVWGDRYDRNVDDIFALQDEITLKIVKSLQVKLTDGEMEYLLEKSTNNIQAWEALTKSHSYFYRHTKDDNSLAMRLAEKAIELDPGYVAAISQMGWLHFMDWRFDWSNDSDRSFRLAEEMANRCLAMDDSFAMAHALLGSIYRNQKKFDLAIVAGERACALDPNNPNALGMLVMTMLSVGRPEEALRLTERAMRIHPNYPTIYLFHLEQVYYLTGQYEEAIAASKKALERQPDFVLSRFHGIACLIAGGHRKEAQARAAEILSSNPEFSSEECGERFYRAYKNPEIKKRFIAELRNAGLPE